MGPAADRDLCNPVWYLILVFITFGSPLFGNLFKDAPVEEGMLLGGHDEVVGLVLVVDYVLEGDAEVLVEGVEEVLLVHEGHAADLLDDGLRGRVVVVEVGRYGYREFSPELTPVETCKCCQIE